MNSSLARIFNQCIQKKFSQTILKLDVWHLYLNQVIKKTLTITDPSRYFQQLHEVFKSCYMSSYIVFHDNEILRKTQWGFRSLHSTALALNNCTSDWLLNIDRGNVNTVVFFDIKKIFDTIDHSILLNKLEKYEICCKELLFFKLYLTNRKQYCCIQNRNSSFKLRTYWYSPGIYLTAFTIHNLYERSSKLCLRCKSNYVRR